MIEREFGKFIASCDVCGETTAPFKSWESCLYGIRDLGWRAYKNKETDEWENFCPACQRLNKKQK